MNFEEPLFILSILVGPIVVIAGLLLYFFPPKKINYIYGYRTGTSMKDQARWDFAQKYAGKLMIVFGVIYSILLLFLSNFNLKEVASVIIGVVLLIAICAALFIMVEYQLRRKF